MTSDAASAPGLPAYGDHVSVLGQAVETGPLPRSRLPYRVLGVIALLLIVFPVVTGMFSRAAQGQQMLADFGPYLSAGQVASLRTDLNTVAQARENIMALRQSGRQPAGSYPYVDELVQRYPAIQADMSGMVDAMSAEIGDYHRLSSLPPFGLLPWFFAVPGAILLAAAAIGSRRAEKGSRTPVVAGVTAVVAVGLIVAAPAFGIFGKAPAAQPLLQRFAPLLTQQRVRTVQGYFVTLVGGEGELDSRYTASIRPGVDRAGIDALAHRWQPMTSRFAGLIGAMNDNVGNFNGVVALNNSTRPLGFSAFRALGWCVVAPGVLALALAATMLRRRGVDV